MLREGRDAASLRRLLPSRASVLAICLIPLLLGILLVGWTQRATADAGEYIFSNVTVEYASDPMTEQPDLDHALVSYSVGWSSETFPGLVSCTWRVYSPGGSLVGETTGTLRSRSPWTDQVSHRVSVSGTPESADITCKPGRLDDPAGRFSFEGVRISQVTDRVTGSLDPRKLKLTIDAQWIGVGKPSSQQCTAFVYDRSGTELFRSEFGLTVTRPIVTGLDLPVYAPTNVRQLPASAKLQCQSFSG